MNLFELFVKIGVDDQASGKLSNLSSKLGNGLKTAAKIGTAAVSAAAAGITALTTAAVNNYAEYEQLVGGVDTLFKASSQKVQEYAENAYKTAGLSANEYMETVTSFSASLLQSLGDDTESAAEYADLAITDMADNANKMGTSVEMIQNAYQGFAKQNYTMLDNLKLGYGGTKTEMQRLIKNANKVKKANGQMADLSIDSFADVVEAIHIMQKEMGISGITAEEAAELVSSGAMTQEEAFDLLGTTAKESANTIQGSVSTMKAAWSNFITSLADKNANYQYQLENLIQSVKTVAKNVYPVVEQTLWSITDIVDEVLPEIAEKIPNIISEVLPRVAEIAVNLVESLMNGISENQEMLFTSVFDVVTYLTESFIGMLPEIVKLGLDLIVSLSNGIAEHLPELIPTIIDVVLKIVEVLTSPDSIASLIQAAIEIVGALIKGIIEAIPSILEAVGTVVQNIIDGITSGLLPLEKQIEDYFSSVWETIKGVFSGVKEFFSDKFTEAKESIKNSWSDIKTDFSRLCANIKSAFNDVPSWFYSHFLSAKKYAVFAWDNVKSDFSTIWTNIKNAFTGGSTWFSTTFSSAKKAAVDAWSNVKTSFETIWSNIKNVFGSAKTEFTSIGGNIVAGIKQGIANAWTNLKVWFKNLFGDLTSIAKKILGIASPSKVFKSIGAFTAEGFGIGFENEFDHVKKEMENALTFDTAKVGISPSIKNYSGIGFDDCIMRGSISITQHIYSEAKTAADLMQEALYHQERAVLLGV